MGCLISDGSSRASIFPDAGISVDMSQDGYAHLVKLSGDTLYRINATFFRRTRKNLNELIGFYATEALNEFPFIHAVDDAVYLCKFLAPPNYAYIAANNYTVSLSLSGRKV